MTKKTSLSDKEVNLVLERNMYYRRDLKKAIKRLKGDFRDYWKFEEATCKEIDKRINKIFGEKLI